MFSTVPIRESILSTASLAPLQRAVQSAHRARHRGVHVHAAACQHALAAVEQFISCSACNKNITSIARQPRVGLVVGI